MEGSDFTNWAFAVAAADAVLTLVFLVFGWSLVQAALRRRNAPDYRPALGRFRWLLSASFISLGVFFGWITLAWGTVFKFHEPLQAILLWVCAVCAGGALWLWRRTPADDLWLRQSAADPSDVMQKGA